jgi:hypothetical protein
MTERNHHHQGETVTRDWAAVATVIDEHMAHLGLNHRELADRSGVALSIVRELRHNTVQRRRAAAPVAPSELFPAPWTCTPNTSHILIGYEPPDTATPPTGDIADQLAHIQDRSTNSLNAPVPSTPKSPACSSTKKSHP